MEWALELALIVLLAATLFHALRLERALGVLKRDRATLENLVEAFNSSTRAAEQGIDRLRTAADGAGQQLSRHVDLAAGLKDDLALLCDRGDRLADRLEALVRAGRGAPQERLREVPFAPSPFAAVAAFDDDIPEPNPRLRSQAERDLVKALRMAR